MLFLLSAAVSLTGQTYVKSFPSGGTLPDGGACNYSTNKCYIVNQGTGTITVIRGSANFADTAPPATPPPSPILSTIALTSTPNPMGIAVNPVTNMIYVASSTAGSIAVIDGATDTLSTTLAVPAASGLRVVAADPVNNYIYAANTSASGSLIVVNGTTNAVTSVAAGTNSYGVAVDPVNHEVYVTNQGSSSVSVFSGATASSPTVALITTISGGTSGLDAPQNLDINPVTNTVYVQNTGVTGLLTIINGADHSATSFAVSLTGSTGIAVDPVTGMVFTDNAAGAIRFDGTTATPLGVPGHRPTVNSQTGQVYFEGSDNNVYVYNQTGTVGVVTLSPGQVGPLNAVLNPAANTVFVTNATSNTVSLIRGFRFVNVSGSPIAVSAGPVVEPYSPQTTFVTVNGVTKAYVESNTNPAVDMITMPTAPGGPITRLQIALSNYGAGCNPTSLRLSPAANKAYFRVTCGANTPGQGGVAYINTSNDTYGGTIFPAPPTQYVAGMEVNPVTDSVFALLKNAAGASQLVVIKSGVAGTPIPLGTNASNAFGVDTAYDRVYVAEYPASTGTLRVLDGNLGFITTVPLPAALTQPNRVQVSPYTHKIYVGSGNTNQIGIVDPTATPPYQNPISIPLLGTTAQPWTFIVFDPSGYAYALQRAARLVSAIRESDNTRISTPAAPALTILPAAATTAGSPCDEPISHTVYVPSGSATAGRIYLIDAMTGQSPPGNGSLSPDATPGGFFLVGSGGTASTTPSNCNITPDGQYLIVSNIGDNTVSVVDLRINQAVPLKVTSAGDDTKDTLYVSGPSVSGPGTGNAIYTTRNQFPPFSVSVTSDYTGLSVPGYNSGTDPLPTAIYYNVDALTAMRAATTPTAGPGTTTVTFEADLSPGSPAAAPLRAGVHYLHIYAAYGDEARMDEFASGPHLGLVATQQFLVAPIPTTTTVTSDVNPQNVSGTVVFTATVTPAFAPLEGSTLPTGGVQFCDGPCTGTNLLGTGTLGTPDPATGAATATLSVTSVATTGPLAAGSHNINAYYEGDLSYESSVGTLTQIISGPATAVVPTAASSPQSVEFPNPFVLNATVEDALGNPVPNAPVDLSSTDGLLFSTSPTGPFTATLSLTSGTDGTMPTVYAKAPGLGTFSATAESDSATPADFTDLTVTPATASSSLLTVNGGASATVSYGDAVTLVDAITPVPPPGDLGTVSFYDGGACAAGVCTGTLLGTVNIASDGSGTATLATTALHVGSGAHTILAQYIGSSTVPETASNTVTVTVNPYSLPASECTTPIQPENVCPALIAIPKPGGRLTTALDSTVYPAAGFTLALAPGASFFNGDTATSITITGTPVFTVTPPDSTAVGVYPVTLSGISTADYLIGFEPGQLSVTSTPTTTQLTVSPNPSVYGQPVTLTATVPELPAGWTGSVNLYDGPTLLCTANVINGVATCTSSSIPAGAHNLTATYDGDQTFAASTSTPV
ncbi:MAG: Ig-like domain repeat protein, partial [Acidobacteriaceae bacterium]|nr:Ig-like domain repeat protein [Acidobacteriaceae bacterium]